MCHNVEAAALQNRKETSQYNLEVDKRNVTLALVQFLHEHSPDDLSILFDLLNLLEQVGHMYSFP